jgi:pimeloyl-ACP methyl ester carboxylesterase
MTDRVVAPVLPHRLSGCGGPLVLISGLGGKGTSWRPFLQIAQRHWAVLTLDNRGAGEAPSIEGPISIRDMARDVLRVLDCAGLRRVPVVGRSMGGMIAQELALLAPERVERLVLASTTGGVDAPLRRVFLRWAARAAAGVPARERHLDTMRWCLGRASLRDPAVVGPYLDAKLASDRPQDYAAQARACARHDALERLGAVRAPTLVIGGAEDRLMPPAHSEALAKAIPGAQLCLIPRAGHLTYLEAPGAFAREVLRFVQGS